jgi:hypothetical protein
MHDVKQANPDYEAPKPKTGEAPREFATKLAERAGKVLKSKDDKDNVATSVAKIDDLSQARELVRKLGGEVKAMYAYPGG